MKKTGLILILLVFGFAYGATITAVASGAWNQNATWDNTAPGCYDTIVIPLGITVTITSTEDLTGCPGIFIWVKGELHFQSGKKLDLPCGSTVYMDPGPPGGKLTGGGGGGSSNWITICGDTYWSAGDGDLTGPSILCDICPLAVELIGFNAVMNFDERTVDVTWETASEVNCDFYTIQRSQTGETWENIGTVTGAGNSTETLEYAFMDNSPYLGISYYRLKQTDYDGHFEVFDPVAVNNKGTEFDSKLLIFPNPSGGNQITVFLADYSKNNVDISLVSVDGKTIWSKNAQVSDGGLAVVTFDSQPAGGLYILRATGEIQKAVIH